ncbi:MAG TPA: thioredoxin domain-containing protein [Ferruginibacter sp.]|nr:thioredoxin domain-containing protein [Ferruginibacter sp.]
MKKFIHLFITAIILPSFFYSCVAQTKTVLTAGEFEKEITGKENIQLLDVRTPGEFFSGHLKNAMLADWNNKTEFDRRIDFIDKSKPVYIYCLGGGRSSAAAAKMQKMGFENIIELKGGINAWKAANLPVDGNSAKKQMSIDDFNKSISTHNTVLVDFGAAWCPPCKLMEPVLKSLTDNNKGKFTLVKVDGGRDEDILKEYKVTALPVFIIFKDGKQVWRKDGIATEKEIANQL